MRKKKIAVIMTVHNRKNKTLACLDNLFNNQFDGKIDCFLTDDGCTDGTAEAVMLKYPEVTIIKGDGCLYWNRGMLAAWKEASKYLYDYYLWLNDDVELFSDAVVRLLQSAESSYNKSIIVGTTLSCKDHPIITYGGRKNNRAHTVITPNEHELTPCFTLHGNIVLIPKFVFEKLGYNDCYYHHSFGDVDYGLAAIKAGLMNYIAPGYYGYCKKNNPVPLFRRNCYSLVERFRILYSPRGYNPIEDFHQNIKYYNPIMCVLWFIKLHLNVLISKDHTKYEI